MGVQSSLGDDAYVEISFSPGQVLVPCVRRFVRDFYSSMLKSADMAERLMVGTHELLENAVRYSRGGQSSVRVALHPIAGGIEATIQTKNQATDENAKAIETLVAAMNKADDPDAYYTDLMRASATRLEGSGLGLGRVLAECGMRISYSREGDFVQLVARGRFDLASSEV